MRLKPYQVIPCKWFVCGTLEEMDGSEFNFFALRLPSYQFMWDWCARHDRWHQLALFYHGRDGFSLRWMYAKDPI